MTFLRNCRLLLSLAVLSAPTLLLAKELSNEEARVVQSIDEEAPQAVDLLERLENINSGTFNPTVHSQDGKVLEGELQALGFTTRWIPMHAVKRAAQLVAVRKGSRVDRVQL